VWVKRRRGQHGGILPGGGRHYWEKSKKGQKGKMLKKLRRGQKKLGKSFKKG